MKKISLIIISFVFIAVTTLVLASGVTARAQEATSTQTSTSTTQTTVSTSSTSSTGSTGTSTNTSSTSTSSTGTTTTSAPILSPELRQSIATTTSPFPYNNISTSSTVAPSTSTTGTTGTVTPSQTSPAMSLAPTTYPMSGSTPAPMVLDVSSDGSVLLRGTVRSISESTMVVDSWGGTWIVRTAGARFGAGSSGIGSIADISVGDFVGLNGTIAQDQLVTVDATFIRDWTTNPVSMSMGQTSSATRTNSTTTNLSN